MKNNPLQFISPKKEFSIAIRLFLNIKSSVYWALTPKRISSKSNLAKYPSNKKRAFELLSSAVSPVSNLVPREWLSMKFKNK